MESTIVEIEPRGINLNARHFAFTDFVLRLQALDEYNAAINLTGYTARMVIIDAAKEAIFTATDEITLGGTTGFVDIDIPESITKDWPTARLTYNIDLIEPGGRSVSFAWGTITVLANTNNLPE